MRTLMSTGSNKPSYCAPNFLMKNLIRAAGASESCGKFRPRSHLNGDKKGVAGTLIRDASLSAPGERNERNRCALIKSRIRTPLGKSSRRTCAGEKIKAAGALQQMVKQDTAEKRDALYATGWACETRGLHTLSIAGELHPKMFFLSKYFLTELIAKFQTKFKIEGNNFIGTLN